MSEVEQQPPWLDRATGIWLDAFESEWYTESVIHHFLQMGKRVCIVSPELHRRPYHNLWEWLKPIAQETNLMLCTDMPNQAAEYFGKLE